jgi:hypothetical protein
VKEFRVARDEAQGYLVVLSPEILATTKRWQSKYNARDAVQVEIAPVMASEMMEIRSEVARNRAGMVAGATGAEVGDLSSAQRGGSIVENYLASLIETQEAGVVRIRDERMFPLGVRWDYYGRRGCGGGQIGGLDSKSEPARNPRRDAKTAATMPVQTHFFPAFWGV